MEKEHFKVTLVPGSYTDDPVKAIWFMWEQSRCDDSIEVMEKRYEFLNDDGHSIDATNEEKKDLLEHAELNGIKLPVDGMHPAWRFQLLLQNDVPIMESIKYSFMVEEIPVSFREQLVRHRVGSKVGPQLFVDDEPGISDTTYWSQTSRVRDLQNFVQNGNFFTPDLDKKEKKPIKVSEDGPPLAHQLLSDGMTDEGVFLYGMKATQWAYRELRAREYKPEICREVLPSCTTHRTTWTVNLKSIRHVFGHRTCWIAFAGYWHPIIEGVINELVEKVSPMFRVLANPPCIDKKTNKYTSCIFQHENQHRMPGGNDPGVPCSLWLGKEANHAVNNIDSLSDPVVRLKVWKDLAPDDNEEMAKMMNQYGTFWNRDPLTGDSL